MNTVNLRNIRQDRNFIEKFGLEEGEDFKLLGHGEYNINYIFNSLKYGKSLVLRIAIDSQMDLENQIEYEYKALELLRNTGRTPQAIYYDDSKRLLPYGFLVMEYLPGRTLDYGKDLKKAAEILSDIHGETLLLENHLISPLDPIGEIYQESIRMFEKYRLSNYAGREVKGKIEILLKKGRNIKSRDFGEKCLINTELNSGNFLINDDREKSYLIDWEKPIYAYPAQDIGHFLAPTTSFWKTDTILSKEDVSFFIKEYCKNSKKYRSEEELSRSVKDYISMNCLRGITWCSMAYVDYQNPDKLLMNQHTLEKIKTYLSIDFLDMIRDRYLHEY